MRYDILDFGAVADGVTLNTAAIQIAIDACNQNGTPWWKIASLC